MSTLHSSLLAGLKRHSNHGTSHTGNASYLGNTHASYHISNPIKHRIAKEFLKAHKDLSFKEFVALLNALFAAPSYDEKAMAAMLIGEARHHRALLPPKHVDAWLGHLIGWAEVDGLCQSNFTADEFLANWPVWHGMLVALSKSKNISKRRASLVLLTGPIAHSRDPRLAAAAFETIARLQGERDILITKAISWLLRSMVRYHKAAVARYIRANTAPRVGIGGRVTAALPAIAVREATRKIKTGRK
jgi:3-methyladenine DNA glycosylase AlkD